MMKYHIITYGCQMNEHDSEKIAGMLESMGYQETQDHAHADIIVFNTCLIRKNAELKVFGKVGSLKQLKEDNPDMIIAVGGCMMQQEGPVDELYQKYPQVDIIFGTHNIHKLPSLINQVIFGDERIIDVWEEDSPGRGGEFWKTRRASPASISGGMRRSCACAPRKPIWAGSAM